MNTQDEHLDYILDRCIERIASGESVSSCLASYPDDREELEPLLRIAAVTMQAVAAVEPNQVAKARGLRMLNEAVAERTARKRSLFGWLTSWRPQPSRMLVAKPLLAGVAVLLVASGLAFGADRAAADSVPGHPLYWVKTSRENLSLMMPKSDAARAQEHARLAKVRSDEMGQLMRKGDIPAARRHSVTISLHLSRSAELVGVTMSTNPVEMPARMGASAADNDIAQLKLLLARDWQYTKSLLEQQISRLPLEQQSALRETMLRQDLNYRMIIAMLDMAGGAGSASILDNPASRRPSAVAATAPRILLSGQQARVVDAGLLLV